MSDSQDVKLSLGRVSLVLAVLLGAAGLFGAWFILPYRMEAAEKAQASFEAKTELRFDRTENEARQQREILIRIDENVKALKAQRGN